MPQHLNNAPTEADRARVQRIIDRHFAARPEGVTRIEPEFDEDWTGAPAVYLKMFVTRDTHPTPPKIDELNDFVRVLLDEIIDAQMGFWPYSRTLVE